MKCTAFLLLLLTTVTQAEISKIQLKVLPGEFWWGGCNVDGAEMPYTAETEISLALDDSSPEGARRFAERPDVFNVAITRSREAMTVLHSFILSKLPLNSLLRNFLLQGSARPKELTSPDLTLNDLVPTLSAIGWKPFDQRSLAGIPIELILKKSQQIIAIDLIGTSGEEDAARYSGKNHLPLIINDYFKRTL
jgi:hypothetical protein